MNKFWNWVKNEDTGQRELSLCGTIAEESWFDDDITPAAFKAELLAGEGPIRVRINSPGGDTIAASQIYTMLMEYPFDVTVEIDGMAASAASVIAMAGTRVCMSPTAMLMIHNPWTVAAGDTEELAKTIALLDEVKESIINAYEIKTGLSRTKISHLMDEETWMNAYKALELGFCDEVLFSGDEPAVKNAFSYSSRTAVLNLVNRAASQKSPENPSEAPEAPIADKSITEEIDASEDPTEASEDAANTNTCFDRISVLDTDKRLEYLRF